jgi:transposase InsO family protein
MLHVISLAQFAAAYARGWAAISLNRRVQLQADVDQLNSETLMLREEIRILITRMHRIPPQRRPHYEPTERMAILELRAARGWSMEQTARTFLITQATIASWMKRVDEEGPDALMQLRQPVNRFPDFVRYAVQRLKAVCPTMGKVKIAHVLCRAGLHLGSTTVGRILKEPPRATPELKTATSECTITSRGPNHIWHVDLTTVPIAGGFWVTWLPFALPPYWPFCWWLALVIDNYSRRAMGFAVYPGKPSSAAIRMFLGKLMSRVGAQPKCIICDRDSIFDCDGFKEWCRGTEISIRYGAAGKHGSIAIVERAIRTLKNECARRVVVPQHRPRFRREIAAFFEWYNRHRPHSTLGGRTPDEIYFKLRPANRQPRIEPRPRWPRRSPCATPRTLIAGQPGDRFALHITSTNRRRHLPIVSLTRAA